MEDRKLQLPVRGAMCAEGCGSAVTTGTHTCGALFGNQLPCLVAWGVYEPDWCPVPIHQEVALAPEQMVSWGLLCSERLTLGSPDPPAQTWHCVSITQALPVGPWVPCQSGAGSCAARVDVLVTVTDLHGVLGPRRLRVIPLCP